jgi:RimJ/RimL family protein N-acetyltransferase
MARGMIRHHGFVSFTGVPRASALADGEHYIHYCRTYDAYAGRGLYKRLLSVAATHIGETDASAWIRITCEDRNTPSVRGIEAVGFGLRRRVLAIGFLGGRIGMVIPWRTA